MSIIRRLLSPLSSNRLIVRKEANAPASLQVRLLTWVLGLVALVWLVVMVVSWFNTEHEIDELLDAHLSQAAALLVTMSSDELQHHDHAQGITPLLHKYQPRVVLQVWRDGVLLLRSATAPEEPLAAATQRGFSNTLLHQQPWRVFSSVGQEVGVVIHVAEQDKSRKDVMRANVRSLLWAMTMAFPLLGLAVWWAVRYTIQPLNELSERVGQRQPDATETLALNTQLQELQPVVKELNRLFVRTAQHMDAERRFTADAAHELRTPIAAVRMQAQVAQAAYSAGDEAELETALAATIQGCDRATRLVEQLLQLARLESQTPSELHTTQCLVWVCAQRVLADVQHRATLRQQHVHLHGSPDTLIPMPETLAMVLLRNLIDNALRYSPSEAQVHITMWPGLCRVEDSGPGLSDADAARLGERFFRVLGSGQSGSGLGWSIVTRIASLYGLHVQVARSPEWGGLMVSLTYACGSGVG